MLGIVSKSLQVNNLRLKRRIRLRQIGTTKTNPIFHELAVKGLEGQDLTPERSSVSDFQRLSVWICDTVVLNHWFSEGFMTTDFTDFTDGKPVAFYPCYPWNQWFNSHERGNKKRPLPADCAERRRWRILERASKEETEGKTLRSELSCSNPLAVSASICGRFRIRLRLVGIIRGWGKANSGKGIFAKRTHIIGC